MGSAPRRALVVIDVQNDYASGALPIEYPDVRESLVNIGKAMDAARVAGIPVVVVQSLLPANAPMMAEGTSGAELHEVVRSRSRDLLVTKTLPSVLAGTDLGRWLRERDVDTMTVIGYMTHNCDDATIRHAVHAGFAVEFLADAAGSVAYCNRAGYASAEEIHRAFSVVLQSRFAAVMSTEEWTEMLRTGATPARDDIFNSSQWARSSRRRIAVSGASGLIGSRLVASLRQRGDQVFALVRRRSTNQANEIFWDPQTGDIESNRLEGLDVVIHLAGKPLDEERWTPRVKEAIYASRVKGTALLSDTIARLGRPPGLLMTASATDYYAPSSSPTSEDGRAGCGFVSEMCQAWEAATSPARDAGIRVVHLRLPSVLAANGHGLLATFLPVFKLGLGPTLGSGRQRMCFVVCDDVVRAIEHIIERQDLSGPVNVLAPEPATNAEFAHALASFLHRPTFLKIPGWVLRLALGEVADAVLEGDADLRPAKLTATGFRFLCPDIASALRHELCH